MNRVVLMADGDDFSGFTSPGSGYGEILLVVGIMFAVVVLIFIWAAFWRKPRRRKHSHHHSWALDGESAELPRKPKRRSKLGHLLGQHRRRRREHRDRHLNPTLAQVGGLPPPRRQERPPE